MTSVLPMPPSVGAGVWTGRAQEPTLGSNLHCPIPRQVSSVQPSPSSQTCSCVGRQSLSAPQTGAMAQGSWALQALPATGQGHSGP